MNISHGGKFTVMAVSACSPVGIDLEPDRSIPDCQNLATWMMNTAEQETFSSFAEQHQQRRFLELWTKKEAILKCRGMGLTIDPRTLQVGWTKSKILIDGETIAITEIDFGTELLCTLCSAQNFHVNFRLTDLHNAQ